MSAPTVAVTGASGFVGGAVCRELVAAGLRVYAFGRRTAVPAGHLAGARYRSWDLTTGPPADRLSVDTVVHCAALVSDVAGLRRARAVNVDGTGQVLRSFPEARVVHVSSASVYHPRRPQRQAAEEEAPDPAGVRWPSAYGRTKAEAEGMLARAAAVDGRTVLVLRPHAVYGPGDRTLLPRVLSAISAGQLPLPGDGRQLHTLTHIDNLTHAVRLACLPDRPSGVFNIADAEPVPLAAALTGFAAERGLRVRVRPVPLPVALAAATVMRSLTRYAVWHLALERTFRLDEAARSLGYRPAATSMRGAAAW